jgi:hypothetical protein
VASTRVTCYHPLFCFNQFGDLEGCLSRPGKVHGAEDWRLVFEPVVARYRDRPLRRYFRADAAFAKPEIYEFLEAEGYSCTICLPTNSVLQEQTAHLLTRPVGRPPREVRVFHCSFSYQAATWSKPRRVSNQKHLIVPTEERRIVSVEVRPAITRLAIRTAVQPAKQSTRPRRSPCNMEPESRVSVDSQIGYRFRPVGGPIREISDDAGHRFADPQAPSR